MNRIFKYALMFAFVGIAMFALSQMSDGAEARDANWDGGGADNLASTKENWDTDVAPIAADNIIINSGSKAITWDITASLGTFTIGTSYSGTITYSQDSIVSGFSMAAGTIAGANKWITCSGDFVRSGGTINDGTLNINLTGTSKTFNVNTGHFSVVRIYGTITATTYFSSYGFHVGSSGIITLQNVWLVDWSSGKEGKIYGTITGGTFKISLYNSDQTLICPGNINSIMNFERGSGGSSASYTVTLNDNLKTVTTLTTFSNHATYTITLDTAGKTITCTKFVVNTRGIVLGGESSITASGDWDDTNGTFTPETGVVILSGTGYCHTDDPGTFYNLQLEGTTRFVHAVTTTAFTANGQWTGRVYYNGTADISTDQQHWTGWLYTSNDIAIEYNSYAYLEFNHDALLGIQLESWSGTDNFTWNATSVASQTVVWSWSRGESTAMYDEYMDTIYIGSDETNAGGMGTFTSTFVGSHAFLLSQSSFLPASTDIDDMVWLGILFMSIATILNFVGYARKIGLLQIVAFLVLLIGVFSTSSFWEDLWTMPALFILSNVVLFVIGMMRR